MFVVFARTWTALFVFRIRSQSTRWPLQGCCTKQTLQPGILNWKVLTIVFRLKKKHRLLQVLVRGLGRQRNFSLWTHFLLLVEKQVAVNWASRWFFRANGSCRIEVDEYCSIWLIRIYPVPQRTPAVERPQSIQNCKVGVIRLFNGSEMATVRYACCFA